jgi:hypothetical protein
MVGKGKKVQASNVDGEKGKENVEQQKNLAEVKVGTKRKSDEKNVGGRPKKVKKKKEVIKAEKVPVVFCSDLNGFVDKVTELRDLPNQETLMIKFGVDEGQGLLKIGVSIIHLLAHLPGHQSKQKYLDSGVFKVFVVAVTPGEETYDNLVVLFEKAGFREFKLPFVIAADLKAVAALVGTSSAGSATYPCPGCLWDRRMGAERGGEMRTFGMCIDSYQRWMKETGRKDGLNKNYFNCKFMPLPVYPSPETLILDVFMFPTVHVLQGVFNHMFQELEKVFPGVKEWPRRLHQKRQNYHNKIFEVSNLYIEIEGRKITIKEII